MMVHADGAMRMVRCGWCDDACISSSHFMELDVETRNEHTTNINNTYSLGALCTLSAKGRGSAADNVFLACWMS